MKFLGKMRFMIISSASLSLSLTLSLSLSLSGKTTVTPSLSRVKMFMTKLTNL